MKKLCHYCQKILVRRDDETKQGFAKRITCNASEGALYRHQIEKKKRFAKINADAGRREKKL